MRSSSFLPLAVILLLLAVAAMEAGAIRLDVQTRASVVRINQMLATNKPSEDATVKGSTTAASSAVAIGENTKRSAAAAAAATVAAEEVRAVAHKLPEYHEDYYGPSDHSPRHH